MADATHDRWAHPWPIGAGRAAVLQAARSLPSPRQIRIPMNEPSDTTQRASARIYKPARNAMQSGRARTQRWRLDFEPLLPKTVEPLMGWTSSADMNQQVSLYFDTAEEAVAYCERHGIAYRLIEPKEPARRKAAYGDNFAFTRRDQWTH